MKTANNGGLWARLSAWMVRTMRDCEPGARFTRLSAVLVVSMILPDGVPLGLSAGGPPVHGGVSPVLDDDLPTVLRHLPHGVHEASVVRQVAPVKQDRQLSHVVGYDPRSGLMRFQAVEAFDSAAVRFPIEFQTGPMVVERNRIATRSIDASINGNAPYRRTMLGYTDEDRAIYFIVTRQDATLASVAAALLGMPAFRGKTLTVVNLDGGASTALHSRNHPELDIVPLEKLPWFLVATGGEGGGV